MAKTPGAKTKLDTYLNVESIVYLLIFPDGTYYIGKTSLPPEKRLQMHRSAQNNSNICKKMKEYPNPRHKIVYTGDYDSALLEEGRLIKKQKSLKCLNQQGVSQELKDLRKAQKFIDSINECTNW